MKRSTVPAATHNGWPDPATLTKTQLCVILSTIQGILWGDENGAPDLEKQWDCETIELVATAMAPLTPAAPEPRIPDPAVPAPTAKSLLATAYNKGYLAAKYTGDSAFHDQLDVYFQQGPDLTLARRLVDIAVPLEVLVSSDNKAIIPEISPELRARLQGAIRELNTLINESSAP